MVKKRRTGPAIKNWWNYFRTSKMGRDNTLIIEQASGNFIKGKVTYGKRGNMEKTKVTIKYNEKTNSYYASTSTTPIESKKPTDADLGHMDLNEFDKIFPKFDPSSDVVNMVKYGEFNIRLLRSKIDTHVSSMEILPSGIYTITEVDYEYHLRRMDLDNQDRFVDLSVSMNSLREDMETFFNSREVYDNLGMRYRRGCLLYGAPGNGKTYNIIKSVSDFCKSNDDMLCIIVPSSVDDITDIKAYCEALYDRRVVFVIEEITNRLSGGSSTEALLSFLDGEYSWNNSYVIATTNYPDKLPENIVDRPGRFDVVKQFAAPTAEERRKYLTAFLGDSVTDKDIESTEGFSVAYLKELVLRSKITKKPVEEIVSGFKELKRKIKTGFDKNGGVGF